jgi:TIR domain
MEPRVFISHSSKDKSIADAICNQLESTGIRCWIAPRDIEVGFDWTRGIMQGLAECQVFVLVFTANSNDSEHVGREVAKAFSLGSAVIPFRIEAVNPRENLGYKTGDDTAVRTPLAALPPSLADDRGALTMRLWFALVDRDWAQVKELIEKMKGGWDEGAGFAYGQRDVPVSCYSILLALLQGEQPGANVSLAETREQLNQKVEKSPGSADLLSQLAVVDALLSNKEAAISEAKRAVELLPISKDALEGPFMEMNLAVVYTWTNELDLAFAKLRSLTKVPNGIFYGQLKRDSYWEPLRQDPRYEKLLAELAPLN